MRVLCLSNGHGEDAIAVQILKALQTHPQIATLAALPLVGEGQTYQKAEIEIIGPVKALPSGGFIYMDGRELAKDVQGGLLQLTLKQLRSIRSWSKQGGVILAVGDIVPLLFAWLSGLPYVFVGTAKSEYYLRDEVGLLPRKTRWERWENWSGSVYLPWERWLMRRPNCRAVFPRDTLTTEILQQKKIRAWSLGNPMMDGLELTHLNPAILETWSNFLKIVILPGSRPPEANRNWQRLLQAVDAVLERSMGRKALFLGAIAPSLDLEELVQEISKHGWRKPAESLKPLTPDSLIFSRSTSFFQVSQQSFATYLQAADLAIAMAGTASEQFAGLGKPIIALAGSGPQFTLVFAEAQTRLLGASVNLARYPAEVADLLDKLLSDPDRLQLIAQNGYRRMGKPGAGKRIAEKLVEVLGT
jgi:uncharacterized protein (TIGR03492 family)